MRRTSDDTLTGSSSPLTGICDSFPRAVIATDPEGKIVLWNRAAAALYGRTAAEALGLQLLEVIALDWSPPEVAAFVERLNSGEPWKGDASVRRQNGSTFLARLELAPIEPAAETAGMLLISEELHHDVESEELYRSLFENSVDAVLLAAPDGSVLAANPAAVSMFGWTEAELRQVGSESIIAETSGPRLDAEQELATTGRFAGRQTLYRRDGSTFIGDVTIGRFRDRSGQPRSTVVIRDVTEEAEAVRALKIAEEKFRTLVENALVGVYILKDGRHVYTNPEMLRTLRYDEKTLQSMKVIDLVVDEDRARVMELMSRRSANPSGTSKYSARVRRGDGAIIELEVHGTVIEYEGGPAIIGTAIDVTENSRAIEELHRSETRYRTLVEEAQDVIFTCDNEGRLTSLNRAFEELTGWKCPDWIGRSFLEVLAPESAAPAIAHFEAIKRENLPLLQEYRLRTASGKTVVIEGTARQLHLGGELVGTIGIVRDITQRRRLEAALERSSRLTALGRVAATLAHEFNNVLMGIQATTDLLQRSQDPAVASRSAASLKSAVQRGRRVTQEVLRFSNMPEPELEILSIRPLVEHMRPELDALTGSAVRLQTRFEVDNAVAVNGDRAQLQQVVTNLVVNARDAMPSGGTVTMTISERKAPSPATGNEVVMTVSDTGVGMAPEMIPLIFEPLFTTKKSGGTGLGLTVVAQIVERHHGTIEVRSSKGEGTEFEIALPAAHGTERHAVTPPRTVGSVQRLLIVDDDEAIVAGLSAILELEGVTVESVSHGAEVEEAVQRFEPQIVLLDLNLPDASGLDVYRTLVTRWPDLPVIISSGHAEEGLIQSLAGHRGVGFLLKPYELETLMRAIEAITTPTDRK